MDPIEEPGTVSETPKKGSKSKATFTCDICGKSYKYLRSYVKHQEEHKIRGSASDKPGAQSTPARIPVVKSGKRGLKSQPCAKLSRESKKEYRNTVKPSKINYHERASGSSEMPTSGLAITHHTAENVQMKEVEIEAAASCSNSLVYTSYTNGDENPEPIESDGMIKITKVWSLAISQAEFLRMLEAEEKELADLCSESTGDKEL
nr:PREDICTED: uncharacterized protein LOC107079872 isoform X1 [Lepisosteus oculatus]XP_015222566.1 PREDICTED: uncharacterized protein LOC107079872 isoform X1 [Lepisosteus oculatus]XP_015222567.1 PREDICTED: uncharacterized protein LOC107079872 isoform X1 [Lepisosteus oculatus]XP_015222568.1 PREDICTED: uncharacterized protein LOC107079872 isoform X1 [Lepisosteus oculatus]XP_015222570.1 PREDICTED: uncharacterized protein LOC107079872 isoform X1 [Lepisosteus oculatus]XP_015222571.1 PREDICTED: unch